MAIFISLGSNIGDRVGFLKQALTTLNALPEVAVGRVSSFYETKPVGKTDQDWFINAAAEIDTSLSPLNLLKAMQRVENSLGRRRVERWGPRTIDLDIIIYDRIERNSRLLALPHPRALERAFVLVPLAEIAPLAAFPGGITAANAAQQLEYSEQLLFFQKWDGTI